jgi:hypothetical protein
MTRIIFLPNKCRIRILHLCILLIGLCSSSFAQKSNSVKGKVTNADGTPIINCSVFINSTSKGTVTNSSGEFELTNISDGKYELIVSSIGYETYVTSFSTNQLPLITNIRLKQKSSDLSTVVVEPFLKDGWETWGKHLLRTLSAQQILQASAKY